MYWMVNNRDAFKAKLNIWYEVFLPKQLTALINYLFFQKVFMEDDCLVSK